MPTSCEIGFVEVRFVAIDMIFHGWAYIWLSLAVKAAHAHY